jgi:1-deoxy-D-xylulose-5-phosphate synthase
LVSRVAARHVALVTIEENAVAGGAGAAVGELLAAQGVQMPLLHLGIPDRFVEHGSREDCLRMAGLDAATLEAAVGKFWERPGLAPAAPASA